MHSRLRLLAMAAGLNSLLCARLQMGMFYFLSPRVTRSLVYGLAARNRLDLYRPPSKHKRPPEGYRVVIYITGVSLALCSALSWLARAWAIA